MKIRTPIFAFAVIIAPTSISHADNAPAVNAFDHIVVIIQENHSFDNLYGLWDEVNGHRINGPPSADAPHTKQVQADSETPYTCLLQNDVNLTSPSPLPATCSDRYDGAAFPSAFANAPFKIEDYISATDTTCPGMDVSGPNGIAKRSGKAGGCTRDLTHRFYNEQYQIHEGKQDRYVTGSDAAGLVMGYYDTGIFP